MFQQCPFCNIVPIVHTGKSQGTNNAFVELVCGCPGEACQVDLNAVWQAHISSTSSAPQPNNALLAEVEQLRAAQADTNRIRKVRDEWLEIALAHKKKIDTLLTASKHLLLALDPNKEQMLHNQAEAMALVRDAIYQVETKGVKSNECQTY